MSMSGKTALITGAARGLGLGIARRFASDGAAVLLNDLPDSDGEAVAEKLRAGGAQAKFVPFDVGIKTEVDAGIESACQEFGPIDILINNAALNRPTPFTEITEEDFDLVLRTNLKSVFLCSQAVARQMIERSEGGTIINMSSVTAIMSTPSSAAYAATKGGVASLTKSMALSLAPHSIRVNAIAPGTVVTATTGPLLLENEETTNRMLARTPMGRFGEPDDIAGVAAFLASNDAAYMTGQTLYVDGGRMGLNYTVAARASA